MRHSILIVLIACSFHPSMAIPPITVWNQANTAYSKGDYAKAVSSYLSLIPQQQSISLYHNLAHAALNCQQTGLAVWSLERALTLSPNEPTILSQLKDIRREHQLAHPKTSLLRSIQTCLSIDTWTWIASVTFWSSVLIVGLHQALKRRYFWWTRLLLVTNFCLVMLSAAILLNFKHDFKTAIITAPQGCELTVSPTSQSPSLTHLKSGETIVVQKAFKDHFLVHLPQNLSGWIATSSCTKIWDAPQNLQKPAVPARSQPNPPNTADTQSS